MKIIRQGLVVLLLLCILTGCISEPVSTEKLRDLEFTVVDKLSIPEEFQKIIEENKHNPFQLTYADNGELYIAQGYGAQLKTGYSVKVTELYETENAVWINTCLMGPGKEEKTKEITTFPYVVVKLKDIEKNVVFD